MKLIASSDPDHVVRYKVRSHYAQQLVLVSSVCRELYLHPNDPAGGRAQAALDLLSLWMRQAYDLPSGRDFDYRRGLDDLRLGTYASDFQRELELGTKVCEAHFMLFTADTQGAYDSDRKRIQSQLDGYMKEFPFTAP